MKIYISYSRSETVSVCFWRYFFKACGVWSVEDPITEQWKMGKGQELHLFLLTDRDADRILQEEVPGYVYLVRDNSNLEAVWGGASERKDVILLDWKNRSKCFQRAIDGMLRENESQEQINMLLDIFLDHNIWESAWLFEEISQEDKGRWDDFILKNCNDALNAMQDCPINIKKMWHYRFMELYVKYIRCGVQSRDFHARIANCKEIMKEFGSLKSLDENNPSLNLLYGRICELSSMESKYALFYYQRILQSEQDARIYYDIGHIYEKVFYSKEQALVYYKKAYNVDPDCFRATYKFALDKEEKEKWIEAFSIYGMIRKQLSVILEENKTEQNAISIRNIEYHYKACKRMAQICQNYLGDRQLAKKYWDEIDEEYKGLSERKDFGKLFDCMSQNQEHAIHRNSEIMDEIRTKFNGSCYR